MGCVVTIVWLLASVPPFKVMVLLTPPKAPYSAPSLLANEPTMSLPSWRLVSPVYLFTLLMVTLPVPFLVRLPLPMMLPVPSRVKFLALLSKVTLDGDKSPVTWTVVALAWSLKVTASPVTKVELLPSCVLKFSLSSKSQMPSVPPSQTTSVASRVAATFRYNWPSS